MFSRQYVINETKVRKQPKLTISGRTETIASLAQQRIWLHEKINFESSDLSVYNLIVPFIIKRGSLLIERIHSILLILIEQYMVFRTAVRFDPETNQIKQYILPLVDAIYSFEHSRNVATLEELDRLLTNESVRKHFDMEKGKVLRCHIIERTDDYHDVSLHENDLIVISFHHIALDANSAKPFIQAFKQACWINRHQQPTLLIPQYIDVALYEQAMLADTSTDSKMNKARRFWSNLMNGYDWTKTQDFISNKNKTNKKSFGRSYSVAFTLDQQLVDGMALYATENNITMFSLCLACYYILLMKLVNDDDKNDLCIASVMANRSQGMENMIGMFVNVVPYRMKMEPEGSFSYLTRKVQELSNNILEHAYLPYQHIINSYEQRDQQALPSILFQYESLVSSLTAKNNKEFTIDGDIDLGMYFDRDRLHGNGVVAFDTFLTISHDHHAKSIECFFDCSADIYQNQTDVDLLAKRFKHILTQLFGSQALDNSITRHSDMPIYQLSLVLPEDIDEIKRAVFFRLQTIENEGIFFYFD
ncbi:hypothetical protein I4U23_010871 [Adineta vaga]|nr:hypothetical protein I4U23_010871 [Adineta vaga]